MVMASLTLPVAGEKTGYGSSVGTNPYTAGAGAGIPVTVQGINRINRIEEVIIEPTLAALATKYVARVDSITGNIVRVRVYQSTASVANHTAANVIASIDAHAVHSHALAFSAGGAGATVTLGAATLAASSGAQVVAAGGAAGDGVRDNGAVQTHTATATPVTHTITATSLVEVGAIDLSAHTVRITAKGF